MEARSDCANCAVFVGILFAKIAKAKGGCAAAARAAAHLLRQILARAVSVPPGKFPPRVLDALEVLGFSSFRVRDGLRALPALGPRAARGLTVPAIRDAHKAGLLHPTGGLGRLSRDEVKASLHPGPARLGAQPACDGLVLALREDLIPPAPLMWLRRLLSRLLEHTLLSGFRVTDNFATAGDGSLQRPRKQGLPVPPQVAAAAFSEYLRGGYRAGLKPASCFRVQAPASQGSTAHAGSSQGGAAATYTPGAAWPPVAPDGEFAEVYRVMTGNNILRAPQGEVTVEHKNQIGKAALLT